MKKQLGIVGAVLLGLIIFSLLATIVTRAQEPGASATVVVDEAAREYRVRFSGLVDFGAGLPMRFRFDLSDRRCKDPARLTAGGTHIERLIYDRQAGEGGGTIERKEAIGPQCPFHVKHTLTVRLWSPSGDLLAHGSAPFCLGGCEEAATATPRPTPKPEPTVTRVNTPTSEPTSAPATKTVAPTPTPTPVSTATATVAIAPTETATATATATKTVAPTSTPVPWPAPPIGDATIPTPVVVVSSTPIAVKPVTTEVAEAGIAVAVDAGRDCIPKHAGAPVRLCPTHSGSGWWIYDSETGQIFQDAAGRLAYVFHVKHLPAGRVQVLFASERLVATWMGMHVVVRTRYGDGKAYVFSISAGGRIAHREW